MSQFAKVFDRPKYGQVVMILKTDEDDNKPELRCFVKPDELGVCQVAIGFDDWDRAEEAFARADEALADQMAAAIFEPMNLQPNARGNRREPAQRVSVRLTELLGVDYYVPARSSAFASILMKEMYATAFSGLSWTRP